MRDSRAIDRVIAPSLLACDLGKLTEEAQALEAAGVELLHFDVMDGAFVPNLSFGIPVLEAARKATKVPIDVHLMVENPDRLFDAFAKAGASWISVHVEACRHLHRTVSAIRELGVSPGVAVNPGTSLHQLDVALDWVDYVLVMSVNPGFGGQAFISESLHRISELKAKIGSRPVRIEVDGGIKASNVDQIAASGADILVMGTGFFDGSLGDYRETLQALKVMVGGQDEAQAKKTKAQVT